MPKDKDEKKKLVVVEEVDIEETPEVEVKEKAEVETTTDKQIIEETKDDTVEVEQVKEKSVEEKAREVAQLKKDEVEEPLEYQDRSSSGVMWIIVLTALLVGALAGGFITYFSGLARLENPQVTPTPVATEMPSTTPTPAAQTELKREDLTVQILNGSGVAGAAGQAKAALEKLGYKNVQTGNASASDFAETEVAILKAKENYFELVKKDLEDSDYTVSATAKTAPTTSKFDVVITLGKN